MCECVCVCVGLDLKNNKFFAVFWSLPKNNESLFKPIRNNSQFIRNFAPYTLNFSIKRGADEITVFYRIHLKSDSQPAKSDSQ